MEIEFIEKLIEWQK